MTDSDDTVARWRRSTWCDHSDCVEVGFTGDQRHVLVRDTAHLHGRWLAFPRESWQELLRAALRGELDHG